MPAQVIEQSLSARAEAVSATTVIRFLSGYLEPVSKRIGAPAQLTSDQQPSLWPGMTSNL
jgi:hypothetical protein